jgi:hypothetical protein
MVDLRSEVVNTGGSHICVCAVVGDVDVVGKRDGVAESSSSGGTGGEAGKRASSEAADRAGE